jgi:hypothetical protein
MSDCEQSQGKLKNCFVHRGAHIDSFKIPGAILFTLPVGEKMPGDHASPYQPLKVITHSASAG